LIIGIVFVAPVVIAALMYAYEDIFNAPQQAREVSDAPASAASQPAAA
jgi:hypothetical protein